MHRVLISSQEVSGDTVAITTPGTLRHLDVLRVRAGEALECFDGTGRVYRGTVSRRTRARTEIEVHEERTETPPRPRVALAVGLIRAERFEWMVQKAAELGVAEIVPLYTERARSRPSAHGPEGRLGRWRRIAMDAAAQSGRAFVPTVRAPEELPTLLTRVESREALLFTLEGERTPLGALGEQLRAQATVTMAFGPEGDFTPAEVALARGKGVTCAGLGRVVLRTETAALAALAIVQHLTGHV